MPADMYHFYELKSIPTGPMSRPLVIDCFLYNGEPIVKLRLAYLAPHVDYFVITEARYSFTNVCKSELFYNKYSTIFEPYRAKIIFLEIDKFPDTHLTWNREAYQRDYARQAIIQGFIGKQYIVLCCDSDEIPSIDTINLLVANYDSLSEPYHLEMRFYYYNFDWYFEKLERASHAINDVGFVRNGINSDRFNRGGITFPRSGWHFSYFLSFDDIRKKIESFSHTEYDHEQFKSRSNAKECVEKGLDLFHRGQDLVRATPEMYRELPDGWKEFAAELKLLQS